VAADDIVGDIAVMPTGAPRPGDPQPTLEVDALGQVGKPERERLGGDEDADDEIGRTLIEKDPLSRLKPELAGLWVPE
jgi:hypothetical protein